MSTRYSPDPDVLELSQQMATDVVCGNCGPVSVLPDNFLWIHCHWVPTSGCCPKCGRRLIWADAYGEPQPVETGR